MVGDVRGWGREAPAYSIMLELYKIFLYTD